MRGGQVLGFPWGKLASGARLMRGTYRFAELSYLVPFPSSVNGFAAATFYPRGMSCP